MTYSESLRDPRWQRKRLEIMDRDDFTCKRCGKQKKTLHVHHMVYVHGRRPWEYPDDILVTICEDCHKILTAISKSDFSPELGLSILRFAGISTSRILGYIQAELMASRIINDALINNDDVALGFSDHFSCSVYRILANVDPDRKTISSSHFKEEIEDASASNLDVCKTQEEKSGAPE